MRIVLCFLLALVAAPAWAEWVKVAAIDKAHFYIDPASIRKDGNLRKVWMILDLKQRDKSGVMSLRTRYEYDCKEERERIIAASTHSGPMAGGETLMSDDGASEWKAIPPSSITSRILKIVCTPVAAPYLAEWVKVAEAGDESVTFYIDPASLRKEGNLRKVWLIYDLKQRDKGGVMSRLLRNEYDCKEERHRMLAASSHSGPMAGGLTLGSFSGSDEWSANPPGSIGATVLNRVCAK